MIQRPLSRRTFLRGCGVSLSLPVLDAMRVRVRGTEQEFAAPTRSAFFYIPNGVVQSAWHPAATGDNFPLSPTLEPLAGSREKITLVSKLDRVKVPGTDGHAQASSCWLSSAAPDELSPAGPDIVRKRQAFQSLLQKLRPPSILSSVNRTS